MAAIVVSTPHASKPVAHVLNKCISAAHALLSLFWLFTESNFATFVLPNTAFGLLSACAGARLTSDPSPTLIHIALRAPAVLAFNWSNIFIFDLANQRLPESRKEDAINKPWRPLVTRQITELQTRRLAIAAIPLVLAFNFALDVGSETALLLILTWLYNDLKGGDEIIRDIIISAAFAFYNHGSLRLALAPGATISYEGYVWIGVISAVIVTTMQVQDLKDRAGDATRGRATVPLYFGERFSRLSIAAFVPLWTSVCLLLWRAPLLSVMLVGGMGANVSLRVLGKRTAEADDRTWRRWCLWCACLYTLPVFAQFA